MSKSNGVHRERSRSRGRSEASRHAALPPIGEVELSELSAVSPVDGRYRRSTKQLASYFSEFGLIRYRVHVEIEYFLALVQRGPLREASLPDGAAEKLRALAAGLTLEQAAHIKSIERVTNHDIKAVEYFIKEEFEKIGLSEFKEWVHFSLTSQDINNTSIPALIKDAVGTLYTPGLDSVLASLREKLPEWDVPMLARTHGQPASPTNLAKEMKVFIERLENQKVLLSQVPHTCKFGGATGNMNAHLVTYPDFDWRAFANAFCQDQLGLQRQQYTTQIEHYDNMAALFDAMKRINVIPIDFENAEGNLGVANAILEHLSAKLPISRLQRDLTDSTVTRNVGVPFGHVLIAFASILRGLGKLIVNKSAIDADLDSNWAVVAEALQNILRREAFPKPYEAVTQASIHAFVDTLSVSDAVKKEMKAVTPFN